MQQNAEYQHFARIASKTRIKQQRAHNCSVGPSDDPDFREQQENDGMRALGFSVENEEGNLIGVFRIDRENAAALLFADGTRFDTGFA